MQITKRGFSVNALVVNEGEVRSSSIQNGNFGL